MSRNWVAALLAVHAWACGGGDDETPPKTEEPAPITFGTIGSGNIPCVSAPGGNCGAGSACCDSLGGGYCYPSLDTCCPGLLGTQCTVIGCDEPSDCPGAVCCSSENFAGFQVLGSSCKPSCDPATDRIVCVYDTDCPAPLGCYGTNVTTADYNTCQ